ncbi:MAG: short-chain dehydrogenase [Acidimicrobiales bacterium]|nr:short-chain dehydrogenase [Acidimicrobiales bacterium]
MTSSTSSHDRPVAIDGATVLITGASSGIGAAAAVTLAERGATVGLVARRADRLAEVLEACQRHTPRSRMWVADLSDTDAAAELALQAWDELGGLDVLVNNAGAPKRKPVTELSLDEVRDTMTLNFESPVRMTFSVLPRMLERDAGLVVNVASFAGRVGVKREAAYCASKFALCGWSEAMALDLWHTGVGVRLVLPGAIDTEIWDQPDNDPPVYEGPLEPVETLATGIADAIESDRFEHYLPDMHAIVEYKTSHIDEFMQASTDFVDQHGTD